MKFAINIVEWARRFGRLALQLKTGTEHALRAIDGDAGGYIITPKPGNADTEIQFVYRLPALTTFKELVIPHVLGTPSPSQTFVKELVIDGSDSGPRGSFATLAQLSLSTHSTKGERTSIAVTATKPIRWIRLSLSEGSIYKRTRPFLNLAKSSGMASRKR